METQVDDRGSQQNTEESTHLNDKIIEGRCPNCGEIFRFYGSKTMCNLCGHQTWWGKEEQDVAWATH